MPTIIKNSKFSNNGTGINAPDTTFLEMDGNQFENNQTAINITKNRSNKDPN